MIERGASSSEDEQADRSVAQLQRRLNFLTSECIRLEDRLARVEGSIVFRTLRAIGALASTNKQKLGQVLRSSPFHGLFLRWFRPVSPISSDYQRWASLQEALYPSAEDHRHQVARWSRLPEISVIMPVHNPDQRWLSEAVDSVCRQTYPHWQLCICDDNSAEAWVAGWIEQQSRVDPRIRFIRSNAALGISGALNRAGTLATGQYLAWLDHDDVLHPYALHYVAEQLQDPAVDVVYTDEDHLDSDGNRNRPHFKPAWSPELLLCCMYWGHLVTVRRELVDRVGWFRSECDGSQDHDLALRITDHPVVIRHVPRVLYHWREHPGSTALTSAAKPYTRTAAIGALQDTLRRRASDAAVYDGPLVNTYIISRRSGQPPARVSIVLCSRNADLLRRCLQSVREGTGYKHYEVIVVQHVSAAVGDLQGVIRQFGCKALPWNGPFNFSRMNNSAMDVAEGPMVVFLNDDAAPLVPDWLEHIVAHLEREDVGAVGAKLLYPSGAIQHAGIAIGMMDGCGHPGRGTFRSDLFPWLELPRDVSAVTGACLGIRKDLFQTLSGFDPDFPVNYGDVDLCLKVWRHGHRVIYDPRILLRHEESASRGGGTTLPERQRFFERWRGDQPVLDPFFPSVFDYSSEVVRLKT